MSVNTKVNGQLVKSAGLYSVSTPIGMADIYSTEEKEVGVWTDGKPLYQKTIDFGELPNNTTKQVNHNVSNIETVVEIKGVSYVNNLIYGENLPPVTAGKTFRTSVRENVVEVSSTDNWTGYNARITFKYTKTTDTPWSGKFVPQGYGYVSSGDIYSFEERQVGVWTDGKPLYQKTVDCGALPNSADKATAHGVENIDKIVSVDAIGWRSVSPLYIYPIPYAQTQVQYQVGMYMTPTEIHLQTMYDASAIDNSRVTIKYTKTTDVAGSGEYVPSGDKAVHYDDTEQVIGTWFGETLYRRTFDLGSDVTIPNNTWYASGVTITNLDKITNTFGVYSGGTFYPLMAYHTSGAINLLACRDGSTASVRYLTLEYTKTS